MAILAESLLSVDYLMFMAARIAIPGSHLTLFLESTPLKLRYRHGSDPVLENKTARIAVSWHYPGSILAAILAVLFVVFVNIIVWSQHIFPRPGESVERVDIVSR